MVLYCSVEPCGGQLAYQAWVTSVKAALRDRQRRQRELRPSERGSKRQAGDKEREDRSNQEAGLESGTSTDTHKDHIVMPWSFNEVYVQSIIFVIEL